MSNKEPGIHSRAAYLKGFSSLNLWYMKQWYIFYCGNSVQTGVQGNRRKTRKERGELCFYFEKLQKSCNFWK